MFIFNYIYNYIYNGHGVMGVWVGLMLKKTGIDYSHLQNNIK